MIRSTNGGRTGETPTSIMEQQQLQKMQQTIQIQKKCGNQSSLLQGSNHIPQNQVATMTNGAFPQHNIQGSFHINAMHPFQDKNIVTPTHIGQGKSASACSVDTSNTGSVSHQHINIQHNSLMHMGLNPSMIQQVQPQSHNNTQSFQGALPLQWQPTIPQREGANVMSANGIGVDGTKINPNEARQLPQMQSNQAQNLQQYPHIATPLMPPPSSVDPKSLILVQQRHVIQQLRQQLEKQSQLQRNDLQNNIHNNRSISSNNSASALLSNNFPLMPGAGQNTPTNASSNFQPQLSQMRPGSVQMNMYQPDAATSMSQQTKLGTQKNLSDPETNNKTCINENKGENPKRRSLQLRTSNHASHSGNVKTVNEQDFQNSKTAEVFGQDIHNTRKEADNVTLSRSQLDRENKIPIIQTNKTDDDNKEEKRGNNHTKERRTSVDSTSVIADDWRSSNDLPDRERIFTCIFNAIQGTKPRGKNISQKLPLMAKRLEERLYRSARTKEDYNNILTLKKRLQSLIFGMGGGKKEKKKQKTFSKKATNESSVQNSGNGASISNLHGIQNVVSNDSVSREAQQKIDELKLIHQNMKANISLKRENNSVPPTQNTQQVPKTIQPQNDAQEDDRIRNIQRQQHRLLLLRHASKCTLGSACTTPYCSQMVQLWNHMRKCDDVHCKTPHCFSSRAVLNHYRICSKQNRTATCEVCSPLIKNKQGNNPNRQGSNPNRQGNNIIGRAPKSRGKRRTIVQTTGQNSRGDFKNISALDDEFDTLRNSNTNVSKNMKSHDNKQLQQRLLIQDIQKQQIQLAKKQEFIKQQSKLVSPQSQEWHYFQSKLALSSEYQQELQKQLLQLQNDCITNENKQDSNMTDLEDDQKSEQTLLCGNLTMAHTVKIKSELCEIESKSELSNQGAGTGTTQMLTEAHYPPPVLITTKEDQQVVAEVSSQFHVEEANERNENPSGKNISSQGIEIIPGREDRFETKQCAGLNVDSNGNGTREKVESNQRNQNPSVKNTSSRGTEIKATIEERSGISQDAGLPIDSNETGVHEKIPDLAKACLPLIMKLLNDPCGWVFKDPVDPQELGLPDYFDIIKKPMDLSLVKKNLEDGIYHYFDEVKADVLLVFQNAILYNGEESEVGGIAAQLMARFQSHFKELQEDLSLEERNKLS